MAANPKAPAGAARSADGRASVARPQADPDHAPATLAPGPRRSPPTVRRGARAAAVLAPTPPDRAQVLVRVASTVAESDRLDALLPVLARASAEAVGADQASLYVYDAARERTVAAGHFFGD